MNNVVIVDVSSNQGDIDFDILKTKAQALYIRFGVGNTWRDPRAEEYVLEALRVGMPYGGYWAAIAGQKLDLHIESFRKALADYDGWELPPVWDCEVTNYTRKSDTTNWLCKLITNSQPQISKPMIYTRETWWDEHTCRQDWPKEYDLWTAHYTNAAEGTIIANEPVPWLPDDWDEIKTPRTWTLWQYSADGNGRGAEFGVQSKSIDIDRFNPDSIEAFNARFGTAIKPLGEVVQPPPEEIPEMITTFVNGNIRNAPVVSTASDIGDLAAHKDIECIGVVGDFYIVTAYVSKKIAGWKR